ncbi:hypothetical protein EFQ99_19890 [Rhizobium vallis]|uniref:Uncharacterized protein n=1 Tax=Rhizobium vallis TaxID=634290 RepID=A0A3S0QTB9_9HYPH|nr:hypothetical protein EFQ99_19890 [Rhizobium vallis]
MVDRPARVVAQFYGQADRSISRPVSANPPADLRSKSARLKFAGRTCCSGRMLTRKGSNRYCIASSSARCRYMTSRRR